MELIKIYQGNVVSAKDLHAFLGAKSKFADWFRNRVKRYEFAENKDYQRVSKVLDTPGGKQETVDYVLSLSMAKELSMVENNDRGREARRYFIKAEETLKNIQQNQRLEYWQKLEAVKAAFKDYILGKGHSEENYVQIDYEGRKVLFNGEPLPDEVLPNILLTARSFAVEMSKEILEENQISDLENISKTHQYNHEDVRKLLKQNTGKLPEDYNPDQDIKKLGE
ncbi:MAG: antA/AntB antirepressor family protein [Flammeovirgaceae bacterium]|nr:antA/AntB antirepressor family protein [Flammeovirgaceae bacterium]